MLVLPEGFHFLVGVGRSKRAGEGGGGEHCFLIVTCYALYPNCFLINIGTKRPTHIFFFFILYPMSLYMAGIGGSQQPLQYLFDAFLGHVHGARNTPTVLLFAHTLLHPRIFSVLLPLRFVFPPASGGVLRK